MNWSVFWEAAGAISTFAAVVVALWQTRYANKKKAKLSFVDKITISPAFPIGTIGYMPETQYVGLEVTNIGNRKIIIKSFFLEMPDNYRAIIQPAQTPIGSISLPTELDIEESVFLPWEKEKFLKFIENEKDLPKDKKMFFCITDSTGVTYKCKTKKNLSEYLKLIKKEE